MPEVPDQMSVDEQLDAVPPPDPIPLTSPTDAKPSRRPRVRASRAKATAPAAGDKAAPRGRTPAARKTASAKQVAESVAGVHQVLGVMVLPPMGRHHTAAALLESAEQAGAVWAQLADRYPLIAKLFGGADTMGALMGLAMVYAPIIQIAMAEHAGMIPPIPEQVPAA